MLNSILLTIAFAFMPLAGERGSFGQRASSVYQVVQLLRGRVLGSLVKEGMTRKQVERILGKDPDSLSIECMSGGIITQFVCYDDLGLRVIYLIESDKEPQVSRVSSVNFCYFFTPEFLAMLANNPLLGREGRVQCIHHLVGCYVSPGMKLSEVGRILRHPTWLDEREIYIYNGGAFAGFIPVNVTQDSTTFNFRVFPDLENRMGAVYFRVSGRIKRDDIVRLLQGEQAANNEDPTILELAVP